MIISDKSLTKWKKIKYSGRLHSGFHLDEDYTLHISLWSAPAITFTWIFLCTFLKEPFTSLYFHISEKQAKDIWINIFQSAFLQMFDIHLAIQQSLILP